jgi:hypothetical protein
MKNTKNKQLVFIRTKPRMWLTVLCSLLLIFSACIDPGTEPPPQPPPNPVNKFEADSYSGNDKIKYSFTYDDCDFYYIYLGELKNIPMFYQTARHHS